MTSEQWPIELHVASYKFLDSRFTLSATQLNANRTHTKKVKRNSVWLNRVRSFVFYLFDEESSHHVITTAHPTQKRYYNHHRAHESRNSHVQWHVFLVTLFSEWMTFNGVSYLSPHRVRVRWFRLVFDVHVQHGKVLTKIIDLTRWKKFFFLSRVTKWKVFSASVTWKNKIYLKMNYSFDFNLIQISF